MHRALPCLLGAAALLALSSPTGATILFDQTDLPELDNAPFSFTFTANSAAMTIQFAGYQVPSSLTLTDIRLTRVGDETNLLGPSFTFVPAACGSLSGQGPLGAFGTNNIIFTGGCIGYDRFDETFTAFPGTDYELTFRTFHIRPLSPSGLQMILMDFTPDYVPEPSTWAAMLLGFGMTGLAMRRLRVRRRRPQDWRARIAQRAQVETIAD